MENIFCGGVRGQRGAAPGGRSGLARRRLIAFLKCNERGGGRLPAMGRIAMRPYVAAAFMLLVASLPLSAQGAPPPEVLKDLAPTGKLRAAINFGNSVLAQKG